MPEELSKKFPSSYSALPCVLLENCQVITVPKEFTPPFYSYTYIIGMKDCDSHYFCINYRDRT